MFLFLCAKHDYANDGYLLHLCAPDVGPTMPNPYTQSGIALQVGQLDDKSGKEAVVSVFFAKEHFPEESDALAWWHANRVRLQRGV